MRGKQPGWITLLRGSRTTSTKKSASGTQTSWRSFAGIQKANQENIAQENFEAAKELAADLQKEPVEIKIKAGEGGKLFGAISSKEIAAAIKEQHGLDVDKKKIVLDEPIKTLGAHIVKIKLHKDVTCNLKVEVVEG